MLKVTPTGRKVFMVAYVANNGQRRKPVPPETLIQTVNGLPVG
jgi:hypothetical protein